jgi:hypothetical protein
MTPQECAAKIKAFRRQIGALQSDIDNIAHEHIADFHFCDYQASTFWDCEKSPIGMCVFSVRFDGMHRSLGDCRYCGEPTERK